MILGKKIEKKICSFLSHCSKPEMQIRNVRFSALRDAVLSLKQNKNKIILDTHWEERKVISKRI